MSSDGDHFTGFRGHLFQHLITGEWRDGGRQTVEMVYSIRWNKGMEYK